MLPPSRPSSLLASARRAWRRSLQLRIVSITLVSSTVLVATFGILVGNTITHGLLRDKTDAAIREVESGSTYAGAQLASLGSNPGDPGVNSTVLNVVITLGNRNFGGGVVVALVPQSQLVPSHQQSQVRGQSFGGGPDSAFENAYQRIPNSLGEAVSKDGFVRQQLNLDLDGSGSRLYLAVGRSVTVPFDTLQLYYFFPLDGELNSASLVRNTLTITGFSLVLMLGIVAALVTRMVVQPVRVAARTAQRLSAGLLDQRMEVKGADDLAALAASFNQMAENLQRHILRLEEMSRLQRRFTSDVSHELRTPLTTVRMAADLIFSERADFEAPVARSAELLQAELDRFEGLLTDLLEISRFDAGFAMLDAEVVDVVPIVKRVVEGLASVAKQAGVRVDLSLPRDPIVAEMDTRRVERILRNLIGNAVEHAEGKPIQVRVAADDTAIAVTVRDHGVGLKQGEEKLVFNRFWRADPSRARQTGGTGLGLSISHEDARLHGGWLEAWGSPGQGAQFRLTLPARVGDRLTSSPLRLVPADITTHTTIAIHRAVAAAIGSRTAAAIAAAPAPREAAAPAPREAASRTAPGQRDAADGPVVIDVGPAGVDAGEAEVDAESPVAETDEVRT